MLDQTEIQRLADELGMRGFGMVVVGAWAEDEDLSIRCFATVPSSHVLSVMESVAANVSLMDYDRRVIMEGELVVRPPDEALCRQAEWISDQVDRHEPMISAAVSGHAFAAFAVGDVPMVTYLATRMATAIRLPSPNLDLQNFTPSPNPGLN